MKKRTLSLLLFSLFALLLISGCRKKAAPPPPPPPPPPKSEPAPPPPKPTIQFSAEPSSVERGQSTTLRWTVSDATQVSISPGVGTVDARGNRQVYPSNTTTYTVSAQGPGGTETASATVSVTAPPPPPPPPPPAKATLQELLSTEVQDAFFDYDKSDIREDARAVLTRNADALKRIFADMPDAIVVLEGHCDERGSAEYNLGLGDRRASSARDFLAQLGVASDKLKTISYGKERPQCTDSNEDCWQRNRRVHFSAAQ